MENLDIAIRSFVKEKTSQERWVPSITDYVEYDRILVFDTETTTDQYMNLTFGSFQIYDKGNLEFQGLFYGEVLSIEQLDIIKSFSVEKNIPLFTRSEFVEQFFYPEVYENHSMCIGFNLPFDLSRLAFHYGNARMKMKGGFSFQLSEDLFNPWIAIKHIDSTKSFIRFNTAKNDERGNIRHRRGSNTFRGRFLDLRTLSFSLTNRKHSLQSAGARFECGIQKIKAETHGKVTTDYIQYNLNDVKATFDLYLKLKIEYTKYNLDTPIHKVYSPASLGKGYMKKMGIGSFFDKNPGFPLEILGYVMTTYYGGRSEVRVRKVPMQIAYMDVLSMYPTVNILQDLWPFVTCDNIQVTEVTQEVTEFLEGINLETLKNQETWKSLRVICLVDPDEDVLPIRAHYGEKNVFNIGINYVTSENGLWYSLSDVISSKLLSGKIPKLKRAIRFEPIGIQSGLSEIEILNGISFDPKSENLFKVLIEERKQLKNKNMDAEQLILKIITNSTSYGIFVEINTNEKKETELEIFGNERFETIRKKVEENGPMFNPIMGAFITSGASVVTI